MNEFEIGDKVRLSNSMLGLDEGRIPIPVPEGVTGVVVDNGDVDYAYIVEGDNFRDLFYEDEMELCPKGEKAI